MVFLEWPSGCAEISAPPGNGNIRPLLHLFIADIWLFTSVFDGKISKNSDVMLHGWSIIPLLKPEMCIMSVSPNEKAGLKISDQL